MKLTVWVFRRPNLFAVNDNLYNMVGTGELRKVYEKEGYKTTHTMLQLYYPERFLNILELRALVGRLENAGFQEVSIITGSEHIICTVHSQNILIVQDELIPEGSQFKLSNDAVGMPYGGGLGVMGGSIL